MDGIEEIKSWIIEHLASVHNVDEVARNFRINPETLRKEFRRAEGVPIGRFVTRERLKQAMVPARDTGLLQIVFSTA
jgi:AraC-like DNA-binding protein